MSDHPTRTVLITGAASGFGAAMVEDFAAAGWRVIATARDPSRLPAGYPRVLSRRLDVTAGEDRRAIRDLIAGEYGGHLDCLVNNAGYGLAGPFEELPEDKIHQQMETNFFGALLLTRELLPALRNARGRVIVMSTMLAYAPFPLHGIYAASKRALEGAFEAMAYETHALGVRTAIVQPGGFRTDFAQNMVIAGDATSGPYAAQLRGFKSLRDRLLKRRGADPGRVARVVLDLATRRRMPLRRRVGLDAALFFALTHWLPQRMSYWLLRRMFDHALKPEIGESP